MGMKPRHPALPACKERLKILNERLNALMSEKDRIIDRMRMTCDHRRLIEAPPDDSGHGPASRLPVRACLSCGEAEYTDGDWLVLTGKARKVDRRTFISKLGRTLKRAGVNL